MLHVTSHDGIALEAEARGVGDPVLLVHANGFCKEMWRPVADGLTGFRIVANDQRGHGGSGVGPPPFDWWDLARDGLAWAKQCSTRLAVGHSSGAAGLAMSEILAPGTWDRLVLIEPIMFPGPAFRGEDHPLVTGALRRRSSFASVEETRAAFTGRPPFTQWTAEALNLYVTHGFIDGADGRRHLVCDPETEAEYYRTATAHGAWHRLGEIACPVTIVVGENSDSYRPEFADTLAAQFRNASLVTIPGTTHFAPMEKPGEVAEVIRG